MQAQLFRTPDPEFTGAIPGRPAFDHHRELATSFGAGGVATDPRCTTGS